MQERLDKIRNVITYSEKQLKVVHSKSNPADVGTRVVTLLLLNKWFSGPKFLFSPTFEWPDLNDGDNFTISNYLNLVNSCIANTARVNDSINNLVNPRTCLISASNKVNLCP